MARGIQPELREFLYDHFESASALEALLVMCRRKGSWTPVRLAEELDVAEDEAMDVLVSLHWQGFLAHEDEAYRYAPRDSALKERVDQLAGLPMSRLTAEIEAYSAPRTFADAFRLKRRSKKDG